MAYWDWIVMLGTLLIIVVYGTLKSRGSKNIEGYLRGDNADRWWTIGLSVMATQASAITFLSTPGQAFDDGMRFVQFYFGLPLAMILISVFFIPMFYRLKVFTAYEFLEDRFGVNTRILTALLFLIQRGLAAGITIYAPAIILSKILGWSLGITILFIGILVIIYTVSGGQKAVAQTHKQQMAVIFTGMFLAFGILLWYLHEHVNFNQALTVAGNAGKMNIIDLDFDLGNRYNIWSGLIGGLFLQLSYFGTDQSQVQRYLSGKSIKESRLGLMFNGLLKVPMQFFILLTGVLVFVFYEFTQPPLYFNEIALEEAMHSPHAAELNALDQERTHVFKLKSGAYKQLTAAFHNEDRSAVDEDLALIRKFQAKEKEIEAKVDSLIVLSVPGMEKGEDDTDYVFITWIMSYLPIGLIGLLLAVIFSAAMSSTSAELNSLAATSTVDLYKRVFKREGSDRQYLRASKLFTLLFGVLAITFAELASLFDNLIEAVNILGSLFYGTILGIFLVAFWVKYVRSAFAIFWGAILAEGGVIIIYNLGWVEYLWLNLIGCVLVLIYAISLQLMQPYLMRLIKRQ